MATYKKDWEIDDTQEIIQPIYNDGYKRYDLSMKDIINGINTSRYPINGGNILVPDGNGNLIPLPDYVGNGGSGSNPNNQKIYRLEILSSNGNTIKDRKFSTILKAVLYEDNIDVTNKIDPIYFKWTRVSGQTEEDQISDAEWNLRWALGAKEIPITCEDVDRHAMFQVQYVNDIEEILWVTDMYKQYQKLNNKTF